MFSYLDKFKNLPADLKARVSGPVVLGVIAELEKKYAVDLAPLVMKVMVKEIPVANLAIHLAEEFQLNQAQAEALAGEMRAKIFVGLEEYLGIIEVRSQKSEVRNDEILSPQISNSPMPAGSQEFPITNQKSPTSNFFFSADDEEEILKLSQKLGDGKVYSEDLLNKKLDEIITLADIHFGSQLLADRFKQILKTYLKGIRERVDVKLTLTKPYNEGGLNLDSVTVDKVISLADRDSAIVKQKNQAPPRIKVPEDAWRDIGLNKSNKQAILGSRDVAYDFKNLPKKEFTPEKLDTAHELAPPTPAIIKKTEIKNIPAPVLPAVVPKNDPVVPPTLAPRVTSVKSDILPSPQSKSRTVDSISSAKRNVFVDNKSTITAPKTEVQPRKAPELNGRVRMEDVKHIPRVLTPIDELKYFSLINFRRLDKDPQKAKNKIKEKIDVLEEERYVKKIEGIQAWRQSPVNKLYLQLGSESISQNKTIDVIIKERTARGEDTLSIEEFEAILQLNRVLRY